MKEKRVFECECPAEILSQGRKKEQLTQTVNVNFFMAQPFYEARNAFFDHNSSTS